MNKYLAWRRFSLYVLLILLAVVPIGQCAIGEAYKDAEACKDAEPYKDTEPYKDAGQYADILQAALAQDGINGAFINLIGECTSLFPGAVNIVVTEDDGRIAYAYNESFIGQTDRMEILISPYHYEFDGMQTSVAVMVDEAGEIIQPFRVVYTEAVIGENNTHYSTYFPEIEEALYERGSWYYDKLGGLTGDLWYYLEKEYKISHRKRLVIVDYVNWEREMLQIADDYWLIYRPISQKDLNLFVLFSM